MKTATTLLLVNLPSIILSLIAGALAYRGIEGWGWFLLVAVILGHTLKSRDKDDDDEEGPPTVPAPPRSVIHRN